MPRRHVQTVPVRRAPPSEVDRLRRDLADARHDNQRLRRRITDLRADIEALQLVVCLCRYSDCSTLPVDIPAPRRPSDEETRRVPHRR